MRDEQFAVLAQYAICQTHVDAEITFGEGFIVRRQEHLAGGAMSKTRGARRAPLPFIAVHHPNQIGSGFSARVHRWKKPRGEEIRKENDNDR